MKIHEFQGKALFRKFDVPVPEGFVAHTPDEARAVALKMGGCAVVKSQIHAGGRGKGRIYDKNDRSQVVLDGGVKLAKTADEARDFARKILGNILVTHQTGSQGKEVRAVLVEKTCKIRHEYYVGMTLDRTSSRVTLMASTEGGMEIEEVAAKTPEKILKVVVDPAVDFEPYQGRVLAYGLGFEKDVATKFEKFCAALCRMYRKLDCSLVEVNPLVLTEGGDLLALDSKINFDENALYRHPELAELRDYSEEDPLEIEAKSHDLSYISLSGNIGCMVNGAGLAMATMDIIKLNGGAPANFLDVGGGASEEKVASACKIILKDPDVRAILVNIFGGIMRCDVIAHGIVTAVKDLGLKLPLVVRLQGTHADIGRKILAESGFKIIPAETMDEAAVKAVTAAKG